LFHVDVEGLVLEPPAVELSLLAVNFKEAIRIVDGLVIGNVTKALEGRGTVIRAQPLNIRTASDYAQLVVPGSRSKHFSE